MERLTYKKKRIGELHGMAPTDYTSKETFQRVVARLAAYEDTELEPEEITSLKADVDEVKASVDQLWRNQVFFKRLEEKGVIDMDAAVNHALELFKAEKDGRLVVLPCRVGDTVYTTFRGIVEENKVRTFFLGHPSYNRGEPEPNIEMIRLTNCDVRLKSFGKTVFLTREEAEAALKKEATHE